MSALSRVVPLKTKLDKLTNKNVKAEEFRIAIVGGRDFANYKVLCDAADKFIKQHAKFGQRVIIICGDAKGADTLGAQYGKERGYGIKYFKPIWEVNGVKDKRAGITRNEEMALYSDATLAFWDGESTGTRHMIDYSNKRGNIVEVVKYFISGLVKSQLNLTNVTNGYWTGDTITGLSQNQVFVFGSNPEGRHGLGMAKVALKFGAKLGVGRGLVGNSYALVTKNLKAGFREHGTGIVYHDAGERSVSLAQIKANVYELLAVANQNPNKEFLVTYKLDTNTLNGYEIGAIMRFFAMRPKNVILHDSWREKL